MNDYRIAREKRSYAFHGTTLIYYTLTNVTSISQRLAQFGNGSVRIDPTESKGM